MAVLLEVRTDDQAIGDREQLGQIFLACPGADEHWQFNSVNGEAPIVVMTTEVLRNMLYAGSPTLKGLGFVVLDEVHYLADRSRGAVWEEVIIHLPESVALVALSATVSNAEEFGDWLDSVRGAVTVIVDEHRPVPLWQHMMVGTRIYDLFTDPAGNRVNPELVAAGPA